MLGGVHPDVRRSVRQVHRQRLRERLARTLAFEGMGLALVTPAYRAATGATVFDSLTLMLAVSAVGALWCVVFDAMFDAVADVVAHTAAHAAVNPAGNPGVNPVERRADRGTKIVGQHRLRLLRAAAREVSEIPVTLPVIVSLTDMSLRGALMTDIALAGVYVVYGFLFLSLADWLCPLPGPEGVVPTRP